MSLEKFGNIVPKVNDIIYYEDNLGDTYILFVKGLMGYYDENSGADKYFMMKVSKTHCYAIDPTFDQFDAFTKTILIDNYELDQMEIMNLTEKYPEYLV